MNQPGRREKMVQDRAQGIAAIIARDKGEILGRTGSKVFISE